MTLNKLRATNDLCLLLYCSGRDNRRAASFVFTFAAHDEDVASLQLLPLARDLPLVSLGRRERRRRPPQRARARVFVVLAGVLFHQAIVLVLRAEVTILKEGLSTYWQQVASGVAPRQPGHLELLQCGCYLRPARGELYIYWLCCPNAAY